MAFTRNFLKSTGLSDEQISAVMEEHVAVTDALKKDRDTYKEQAATIPDLQKQIDGFKGGEDWKSKYEDAKKAFDEFKREQTAKETANKIKAQYRKLLIDEQIGEEWADRILKLEDFSGMELDAEGNLKDVEGLKAKISKEYGDYKTTTKITGAKVENPPAGKNTMTKAEIMAIKDTSARQKAIAEHLDLFGKGV